MLPRPNTRTIPLWKIRELLENGAISLDAPYQRDVVWKDQNMCDLIDSIMNNYYIPPVVFAVRQASNGRLVRYCIDGKQRLTSVLRFMTNRIPFIDASEGTPVEKYYMEDPNYPKEDGTEYLDDQMRNQFNDREFVCVEYSDLNQEDEVEIFSRVQLGVALTRPEKLKAQMTPNSEFVTFYYQKYRDTLSHFFVDLRSKNYALMAQLVLMMKEKPESFMTPKKVDEFMSRNEKEPGKDVRASITFVMETYARMIRKAPEVFQYEPRTHDNKPFSVVEFLVFALYLDTLRDQRYTVKQLCEDCESLRDFFFHEYDGPIRQGNKAFEAGRIWVERQVARRTCTTNGRSRGRRSRVPQEPYRPRDEGDMFLEPEEDQLVDNDSDDETHRRHINKRRRDTSPVLVKTESDCQIEVVRPPKARNYARRGGGFFRARH